MSDARQEAMTKLNEILAAVTLLRAEVAALKTPVARAAGPSDGQARFGNYGRNKGGLVAGATAEDLRYYGDGCRRTLADSSKSNFHAREQVLLSAIEAEEARQQGGPPPHGDGDAPQGEAPF